MITVRYRGHVIDAWLTGDFDCPEVNYWCAPGCPCDGPSLDELDAEIDAFLLENFYRELEQDFVERKYDGSQSFCEFYNEEEN